MKTLIIILSVIITSSEIYSQDVEKRETEDINSIDKDNIPFERPFNFFAAAGAAYRIGDQYNVFISPTDNSVQFQSINPITTRFSLGLVWNPLKNTSEKNIEQYLKDKRTQLAAKAARNHMAVALLINVFKLGYTAESIESSSSIDVGFGVGYRESNFMALLTVEFTPVKTPTSYFVENYKGKNKQLILTGNTEPEREINTNSSLFYDKIFPSIGFKIAYAFSNKNN